MRLRTPACLSVPLCVPIAGPLLACVCVSARGTDWAGLGCAGLDLAVGSSAVEEAGQRAKWVGTMDGVAGSAACAASMEVGAPLP